MPPKLKRTILLVAVALVAALGAKAYMNRLNTQIKQSGQGAGLEAGGENGVTIETIEGSSEEAEGNKDSMGASDTNDPADTGDVQDIDLQETQDLQEIQVDESEVTPNSDTP
jgi:hypothetical protein